MANEPSTELIKAADNGLEFKELPTHKHVWEHAPTSAAETATRERLREFLRSDQVPMEIKALGILSEEMIVTAGKELEFSSFTSALHNGRPHGGDEVLYGLSLSDANLDMGFSTLADYGVFSIDAARIPLKVLQEKTGRVASEIASERPDIIRVLLNPNISPEEHKRAKIDMIRFLAKVRPGSVKQLSDAGGLIDSTGVAYTTDGRTKVLKLYLTDIPYDDPILGEAVSFYEKADIYERTITSLTYDEMKDMTIEKIEERIKKLPETVQRILLGRRGSISSSANAILRLARQLGYSPNDSQLKFEKSSRVSFAFLEFQGALRGEILKTLVREPQNEDQILNTETIDSLFRSSYGLSNQFEKTKIPGDFSITKAISDETPLSKLNL